MNDDKVQCVLAVASTLRQLLQSLKRTPTVTDDNPIAVGERNGQVQLSECAEFVDLVTSLVADAGKVYEDIQALLLNTDPTLIPTLVALLTIAPAITDTTANFNNTNDTAMVDQDDMASMANAIHANTTPFQKLLLSTINCILQIITAGCVDVFESPRRTQDGGHSAEDPNAIAPEAKRLSEMLGAMLQRTELAHSLVVMLDTTSSPSQLVRFGAAKLLFTATLRCPAVKAALAKTQPLLDGVFDASLTESNGKIRAYIVGAIREVAGSHPLEVTDADDNVRCLARLFATDVLSDIRAMAAEAVDVIFRNQPQRWARCTGKKDLSTAIIGRLENAKEEHTEVLIAVLRLLETLLIADAAITLGKPLRSASVSFANATTPSNGRSQSNMSLGGVNATHHQQQQQTAPSFTELFVTAHGERSIIRSISGTKETDSLASRCFRLLVEFAPYQCEVAFNAAKHFPTISVVLKAVVTLASSDTAATFLNNGNNNEQPSASSASSPYIADMRFELSVAVALLLCQDPRVRQLLSDELRRNPNWMGRLRGALLSNLNLSTLGDFSGIRIIDVLGENLSDPRNVEWEDLGSGADDENAGDNEQQQQQRPQNIRPIRDSLEAFMVDQYFRFIEYQNRGGHSAAAPTGGTYVREVPVPDPRGEAPATRLTFILLTNTVHNTFNVNRQQALMDGRPLPDVVNNNTTVTTSINQSNAFDDHQQPSASYRVPSLAPTGGLLADLGEDPHHNRMQQRQQRMGTTSGGGANNSHHRDLDTILRDGDDTMLINELSRVDKTLLATSLHHQQHQNVDEQHTTHYYNRDNAHRARSLSAQKETASSYLPTATPLPGQTRTSLIREWKNNPKKLEAIKQMARRVRDERANGTLNGEDAGQQQQYGGQGSRGGSLEPANFAAMAMRGGVRGANNNNTTTNTTTNSYVKNKFVDSYNDPFKEPTRQSFKTLHNNTGANPSARRANSVPTVPAGGRANNTTTAHQSSAATMAQLVNNNTFQQQQAIAEATANRYTKFDAALRLCEKAGQHYIPMSAVAEQAAAVATKANTTVFESRGDGFAKRANKITTTNASALLKQRQPKTWCLEDLREGDLFYFAIPLNTLSAFAVDQIRTQAVRHLNHLKRSYIVVPNAMKGRRWFIFDMSTYVMPQVIAALDDMLELMQAHGEQNCRFPLLMFKGGSNEDGNGGDQNGGSINTATDAVPEASLNSGNLFESLDQLRFYFSKMSEVNPIAASAAAGMKMGGGGAAIVNGSSYQQPTGAAAPANAQTQYLQDLESKINALKNRQFDPKHDAKFMHSFGGQGAGAVLGASSSTAAGGNFADDDEDGFDEMKAVPQRSSYGSRNAPQQQTTTASVHLSPAAQRARAMLADDGYDEVAIAEPMGGIVSGANVTTGVGIGNNNPTTTAGMGNTSRYAAQTAHNNSEVGYGRAGSSIPRGGADYPSPYGGGAGGYQRW